MPYPARPPKELPGAHHRLLIERIAHESLETELFRVNPD